MPATYMLMPGNTVNSPYTGRLNDRERHARREHEAEAGRMRAAAAAETERRRERETVERSADRHAEDAAGAQLVRVLGAAR